MRNKPQPISYILISQEDLKNKAVGYDTNGEEVYFNKTTVEAN
jgi:hypothetical protein